MTSTAADKAASASELPPALDLAGLRPPLNGLSEDLERALAQYIAESERNLRGDLETQIKYTIGTFLSHNGHVGLFHDSLSDSDRAALQDLSANLGNNYMTYRLFNDVRQRYLNLDAAVAPVAGKFLSFYNRVFHPLSPPEEQHPGNGFLGLIDGLGALTSTDPLGTRAEEQFSTLQRKKRRLKRSLTDYHSKLLDVSNELRGDAVGTSILPFEDSKVDQISIPEMGVPSLGRSGSFTGNSLHVLNGNRRGRRRGGRRTSGKRRNPQTNNRRRGGGGGSTTSLPTTIRNANSRAITSVSGVTGTDNTIRQGLSYGNASWNGINGLLISGTLPMISAAKTSGVTTILQDGDLTNQAWFTVDPTGAETDWLTSVVPRIASCFQRWKLMKFRFTYMPTAAATTDTSRIIFACSSDPENPVIKNASSTYATLQTCEYQMAGPIFSVMHMDLPIDQTSELKYIYEVSGDSERLAHYGVIGGRFSADPGATTIVGVIYATFSIGFFEMNPQSSVLSREERLRRIAVRQSHVTLREAKKKQFDEELLRESKKIFLDLVKEQPRDEKFYTTQCRLCGIEFSRDHGILNDSPFCDCCIDAIRGIESKRVQPPVVVVEEESPVLVPPPNPFRSVPSAMRGITPRV